MKCRQLRVRHGLNELAGEGAWSQFLCSDSKLRPKSCQKQNGHVPRALTPRCRTFYSGACFVSLSHEHTLVPGSACAVDVGDPLPLCSVHCARGSGRSAFTALCSWPLPCVESLLSMPVCPRPQNPPPHSTLRVPLSQPSLLDKCRPGLTWRSS